MRLDAKEFIVPELMAFMPSINVAAVLPDVVLVPLGESALAPELVETVGDDCC